jgi:glycopeptide antibiotics resistance protein
MEKHAWLRTKRLALFFWIGMILWVASRPKAALLSPDTDALFGLPRQTLQYLYHLAAFFILAILLRRSFSFEGRSRNTLLVSLIGCALVSICSEVIQFYVPTRTPAFRDLFVDSLGASMGVIFVQKLLRQDQNSRQGV